MSKKSEFINFIETLIEGKEDEMNEEAKAFWEALKDKKEAGDENAPAVSV